MGNKIENEQNEIILVEENPIVKTNIICPKCPLSPIINITQTKEGTLICEYRCPLFHMGLIKLDKMIYDKNIEDESESKVHGLFCSKCQIKSNDIKNKYKYCGTCNIFLCEKCITEHNKRKLNHTLIEHSKINKMCMEKNINIIVLIA